MLEFINSGNDSIDSGCDSNSGNDIDDISDNDGGNMKSSNDRCSG